MLFNFVKHSCSSFERSYLFRILLISLNELMFAFFTFSSHFQACLVVIAFIFQTSKINTDNFDKILKHFNLTTPLYPYFLVTIIPFRSKLPTFCIFIPLLSSLFYNHKYFTLIKSLSILKILKNYLAYTISKRRKTAKIFMSLKFPAKSLL